LVGHISYECFDPHPEHFPLNAFILVLSENSVVTSFADSNPDPDPPYPYVLGLLDQDLDPLVRGMDPAPDPSIIKQK
jgi:hypothetical protein